MMRDVCMQNDDDSEFPQLNHKETAVSGAGNPTTKSSLAMMASLLLGVLFLLVRHHR